jgi:PhoPQ-activated pathogenicity-related protein
MSRFKNIFMIFPAFLSHITKASIICFLIQVNILFAVQSQTVTPATALQAYLNNSDQSYSWEIKEEKSFPGLKAYGLMLTSQTWKNHVWKHQLIILVPDDIRHEDALLFITGGSNKNTEPNWTATEKEKLLKGLIPVALDNNAVVALIKQVPNQPLYDGLTEDALISMTLHNFKRDGDMSWPLLFPMVKSAVRGMDAVQEFTKDKLNKKISNFVVTGASKRGWTTWLSAAADQRIKAIAPMVIDILNMPVSLDYQIKTWGEYSEEINDYVKLEIPQSVNSESGNAISTMIDPYAYREKLTMPKMIFMGTNDPYWVVDNIKNYYDEIPGQNLIHYVPNAGHDLGDGVQAFGALNSFFGLTVKNLPYPVSQWKVKQGKNGIQLKINSSDHNIIEAILWSTTSDTRDFRKQKWTSRSLGQGGKKKIILNQSYPESGFQAFYVDLKHKNPNGGAPYTISTRMFISDTKEVFLK